MRALLALSLLVWTAGCNTFPPPPPASPLAVESPPDATPHVVRRLIGEAEEQLQKSRLMAAGLTDPSGQRRAQVELNEIAFELDSLAARIDDANSGNLDDVMRRLSALNPRLDDVHDALLVATERTSAFTN